jgi:predicted DNA-binding transcriptional regulator AlpA
MTEINSCTPDAAPGTKQAVEITDKKGFGARWGFSTRHIDNLLAQGCPHLKIGKRRVRIVVAEADQWMKEQFGTRRRRPARQTAAAGAE